MSSGWIRKFDRRSGHYALLLFTGAACFLLNLGGPTLWDLDEGRNATCAFEMMEAGEWVVPTFNGTLRVDKPALLYWLQIFAFKTIGVSEFSARLPSALAGLLTVLVCYELGRRLFTPATGLLAALLAASTPMLCGAARFANPDALLNLFSGLTLALFWAGWERRPGWWWPALGAGAGLAVLAKGPVGLVLPLAVSGLFLLWTRRLSVLWDRRLLWGIGAFVSIALPWYVWVAIETKAHFLRGFIMTHNVERFLQPMDAHALGPFFYLGVLAAGLFPWSIFLPLALWYGAMSAVRRPLRPLAALWARAADGQSTDGRPTTAEVYRFLWCWVVVYFAFFTVAATKLPNYILPTVTPLTILVARFLERWRCGRVSLPAWALPAAVISLGVVGVIFAVVILLVGGALDLAALRPYQIAGFAPWAALGLAPLAGSVLAWAYLRKQRRTALVTCLIAAAFLFVIPLAAWGVVSLNAVKAPRALVDAAGGRQRQRDIRLACFRLEHLPSLHFYCQREMIYLQTEQEIADLLRSPAPVYVFAAAAQWQEVQPRIAGVASVLGARRDIYRGQDVVVVTNQRDPY